MYELVVSEFQKSRITKATLARRLGKRPEIISRLLGAPGNWTLNTVSDLLFAISGGEPEYGVRHPLREPPRNYIEPEWATALSLEARRTPTTTTTTAEMRPDV